MGGGIESTGAASVAHRVTQGFQRSPFYSCKTYTTVSGARQRAAKRVLDPLTRMLAICRPRSRRKSRVPSQALTRQSVVVGVEGVERGAGPVLDQHPALARAHTTTRGGSLLCARHVFTSRAARHTIVLKTQKSSLARVASCVRLRSRACRVWLGSAVISLSALSVASVTVDTVPCQCLMCHVTMQGW